jgi:hypothetical protein
MTLDRVYDYHERRGFGRCSLTSHRREVMLRPHSMSLAFRARIAVLVPCLNEEAEVASVVHGMREALPGATVYVYDNGSTDRTVERAKAAGAVVAREALRARETWCGECSPTSTPTSTFWWTVTGPTTRAKRR